MADGDGGFNGADRMLLRRLDERLMDLRLEFERRMTALETHVEHLDDRLSTKVGKDSFRPVSWLIYTIVGAAVVVTVGAILSAGNWAGIGK